MIANFGKMLIAAAMFIRIYFAFVLFKVASSEAVIEASKNKTIESQALQVAELIERNRKLGRMIEPDRIFYLNGNEPKLGPT